MRRAILLFLLLLTLIVLARIVASAEEAVPRVAAARASVKSAATLPPLSLRLAEPGGLLEGGSSLARTITLTGIGASPVALAWEARLDGAAMGRGGEVLVARGGSARVVLSIPLPDPPRPLGLDLQVEASSRGVTIRAVFPFLVYPRGAGGKAASLLGHARVALYDPDGKAAPALDALGVRPEVFGAFEGLAFFAGDLIVIGPGGFGRANEALGPILAARARSGMRLLLLEQESLPGTLSEDLRLWPAFHRRGDMTAMVSSAHPVLRGLPQAEAAAVSSGKPELRPFLPPTRGNFRIISELRVPTGAAWQEGVTMLELPIGAGTVLAAQSSLCADFVRVPRSRLVLANAIVYLLGQEAGMRRAFLYGNSLDDLPACLARLAPAVARVPADFAGAEILLVAGDWRAQRLAAAARLPAPADVARYLREGGTILLLNPQPLSIEYLGSIVGAPVHFDAMDSTEVRAVAAGQALLEGIAPEDLAILGAATRAPFRVRLLPGRADVEPLLFAPGIAQYRIGRGVLLALSLPDAGACAAPRLSSLLARLLTNLGVPLGRAPGIDPDAVSLLDE